jgi:hypothetical protein
MVTAVLVSMVVMFFAIAVVQLSLHNTNASARDRKRVQAVSAAEAGLDAAMGTVQAAVIDGSKGTYTLPCTASATLPMTPAASYDVTINYYTSYPPTGNPMTCPPTTAPAAATFVSTGTAVTGSTPTLTKRTMQAEARLFPVFGSFGNAIFSNSDLNIGNNLGVTGNQGNDGDLYTNGNMVCSNSSIIAGSALAQGSIYLSNSCTFNQDAWANLTVTMDQSAVVGHDATSSTTSISMSNSSHVNHNAVSGTTCSGCTTGAGGRVTGTVTTSHISPAPPQQVMPLLDYVASAWTAAGFQIQTYSSCATARTAILAGWSGKTVARITPACTLTFPGDSAALQEDVAIISDGPIVFSNHNTWTSSSSTPHILYLMEPTNGITNPNCSTTPRDITIGNNTDFTKLYLFAYSQCTVTYNNNNAGLGGQVIAGTANIANLFNLAYHPIVVPGGAISGFREDLAFIREIVNP